MRILTENFGIGFKFFHSILDPPEADSMFDVPLSKQALMGSLQPVNVNKIS